MNEPLTVEAIVGHVEALRRYVGFDRFTDGQFTDMLLALPGDIVAALTEALYEDRLSLGLGLVAVQEFLGPWALTKVELRCMDSLFAPSLARYHAEQGLGDVEAFLKGQGE